MGPGARVSDKRYLLFIAFHDECFANRPDCDVLTKAQRPRDITMCVCGKLIIRLLHQLATLAISTVLLAGRLTIPVLLPAVQCNLRTVQTCHSVLGELISQRNIAVACLMLSQGSLGANSLVPRS